MPRLGIGSGKYNIWVTLSRAMEDPSETEHFTDLSPSGAWAAIRPTLAVNGRTTEHVVEMLFHPEVTVDTRIVYEDAAKPAGKNTREIFVRGVQNLEEANVVLRLICEEVAP